MFIFDNKVFCKIVGIPMGTNCADLFLYSYESQLMAFDSKEKLQSTHWLVYLTIYVENYQKRKLLLLIPITGVDSMVRMWNNPNFLKFVKHIYPKELTINKTNSTTKWG